METIFITNDLLRAHVAEEAGVDRIMVDLEMLGKIERQGHLDTVISGHTIRDVRSMRSVLSGASLMVRVNPINEFSEQEIDEVIAEGAEIVMLPMFSYQWEVEEFIGMVRRRARTCLLFETGAALANIHDVLDVPGIDEAHIGLNDLHLSLGLKFMFELVSGGLADYMAGVFRGRGVTFGIGGAARLGYGVLPAELVLSEHIRLGSSRVILSRDYGRIFDDYPRANSAAVFRQEMSRFWHHLDHLEKLSPEELLSNSRTVKEIVSRIVAERTLASRHIHSHHALAY